MQKITKVKNMIIEFEAKKGKARISSYWRDGELYFYDENGVEINSFPYANVPGEFLTEDEAELVNSFLDDSESLKQELRDYAYEGTTLYRKGYVLEINGGKNG